MKLATFSNPTKEIFIEADNFSVTINPWHNCEGASLMVHGKDMALRMAGAFRWEEIDAILVALTAARAV